MNNSLPEIATTVVGSYPVPEWLRAYRSETALRDAVLVVLKTQELAGIDVISDGEISRFNVNHPETNGMIETFVRPLHGVRLDLTMNEIDAFRAQPGMQFRKVPPAVVVDEIGPGRLKLPEEWRGVKDLSTRPMKFTVTSPYMLAKTVVDSHYHDIRRLTDALAEILRGQVAKIDAPVVQIDEANLTGNPDDAAWAFEPVNHVLDAIAGQRALHLCFGNYGGQSIQRGHWKQLIGFLNELHVHHLVLEFARRGYDELPLFRDLRDDIALGVGVIDIKDNVIESPDTVAKRIDNAVKVLGKHRIRWVHPDCGFWILPRNVADGKMASLVRGRDLVLGKRA